MTDWEAFEENRRAEETPMTDVNLTNEDFNTLEKFLHADVRELAAHFMNGADKLDSMHPEDRSHQYVLAAEALTWLSENGRLGGEPV